MKSKPNEILSSYFDIYVSPLFDKGTLERYLKDYPNSEATNAINEALNSNLIIDDSKINDEYIIELYHSYVIVALDYIKRNNIHLNEITFEMLSGDDDDYELKYFKIAELMSLNDLYKISLLKLSIDGITYRKGFDDYETLIIDFSKNLSNAENSLFNEIINYKMKNETLNDEFKKEIDHLFIVKYKFGDIILPFVSLTFGFDEFSIIRNEALDLIPEECKNSIKNL